MKQRDFDKLVVSVKQAGRIKRRELKAGRTTELAPADIKSIRLKLKKSQSEFSMMIGVSVATLQNWEQGRRQTDAPAAAYLQVIAKCPREAQDALAC